MRLSAAAPKQQFTPAYSITRLGGEYEQLRVIPVPIEGIKDKNGNQKYRFERKTVKVPRGFLVETPLVMNGGYCRNGSFHVDTLEKLEELGLANTEVPLVDSDGEPVGSAPLRIKKEKPNG